MIRLIRVDHTNFFQVAIKTHLFMRNVLWLLWTQPLPKKIASSLGERNQTIVLSDAKAAARVTAMSKRKQPMDSDGVEESEDDAIGDARTLRSTLCPSRDRSLRIRCRKETICRRRKRKWTGGVTEGGEAREKS